MSEVEPTNRTYPYISVNVWHELRLRFQKSVPAKVTVNYLQTALGFSTEKAAKNLIPQLKTVGLIEADGSPTDLAKRYRLDSEYAAATSEIIEEVYPSEIRDLFPGPTEDLVQVSNWFMRTTGGGQAGAKSQARLYLALASAELPTEDKKPKTATSGDEPQRTRRKSTRDTTKAAISEPSKPEPKQSDDSNPQVSTSGPNLHIDVQVHIAADASTEQIDAVFSSMARHLYGNQ